MRRLFFLCALAFGLGAFTSPALAIGHGGNGPSHLQVAVLAEHQPTLVQLLSIGHLTPPEAKAINDPLHPSHPDAHLWAAQVMEALLANVSQLQRAAPDFLQALQADLALAKATEEAICAYSGWNVSQLQRHDWHAELMRQLQPPSPPWLNALPLALALLLGAGLLARRHSQARLSAA
jgi:hypothetical protein